MKLNLIVRKNFTFHAPKMKSLSVYLKELAVLFWSGTRQAKPNFRFLHGNIMSFSFIQSNSAVCHAKTEGG